MLNMLRRTRHANETRKMYLDHLDSVRMSGLGFPGYAAAIHASLQVELGSLSPNVAGELMYKHGLNLRDFN